MNRVKVSFVLAAVTLLLSCHSASPPADTTVYKKKPQPEIRIQELEKRIHALINMERKKSGLSQFGWDDGLSRIARKHSSDMAKRKYFDHVSPDGHDFVFRYKESGYTCAIPIHAERKIFIGAENILLNYLYDTVTTVNGVPYYDWNSQEKIAESTVRGWMNSPGHRKNILTPTIMNEGIGVVISPDDKVYITQNFC